MSSHALPPGPSSVSVAPRAARPAPKSAGTPPAEPPIDDWRGWLAAAVRHKWLVLGLTAGTTLGAVAVAHFVKPLYAARTTIWIADPARRGGERDLGPLPIQQAQLLENADWGDLVRSRVVIDDVVRAQGLYLRPDRPADSAAFAGFAADSAVRPGRYRARLAADGAVLLEGADGAPISHATPGQPVGSEAGFAWVPPLDRLRRGALGFTVTAPAEVSSRIAKKLHVKLDPGGSFMQVEYQAPSPERAARVLSGIAERFVAVSADLKRERLTELSRILQEQLDQAQRRLTLAENTLRDFSQRNAARLARDPAAGHDPLAESYFTAQVELDQLRRDRAAIQSAFRDDTAHGTPIDALQMIGAVQRSAGLGAALRELSSKEAELRALRYAYTDAHPRVRSLARDVDTLSRVAIPGLAAQLVSDLDTRERALLQQIAATSAGLRQVPPLTLEDARLQRDVTLAEQVFAGIQQRYEEARLAEVSSIPDVRLLDRAVAAPDPVINLGPFVILLGMMLGVSGGVVAAVARTRLDRKVRTPDQVTDRLGLPILGMLPHFAGADKLEEARMLDALRGIRLGLVHAHGAAGPVVVTISSPGSGDGKSFVAANLAVAFADTGLRTVLVDGDARRGALHHLFGLVRKPGLTDHTMGTAEFGDVIRSTRFPRLWFVPCGSRTARAPELLGSAAMRDLLARLRGEYDVIIIDSPPLAAGIDPFVLSTLSRDLLLVLRTGVTDRDLAEAQLAALERLPVRLLGAVLNDARATEQSRYHAYYLSGYEIVGEEAAGAGAGAPRILHSGL